MPGNTLDRKTLGSALASIENQYGKARRFWVVDRGIPTEESLEQMRQSDPPVSYLVGTPKGRLSQLEAALTELPQRQRKPTMRNTLSRPWDHPANTVMLFAPGCLSFGHQHETICLL